VHRIVEQFIELADRLGHWGYLLIFVVVLLECQALLGLFVPGESMVLVAGFLAGQGVFFLDALIITVAAGAIVGDSIGYEVGRHFGTGWLRRHGARVGIRDRHFERVDGFIRRHGGKSVFLSHFLHVLRALMPFMAGANRMAYGRFVLFNALGCMLWATVFVLLGYVAGESWQLVEKWMGRAGGVVGAVIVLILALARLWSWLVQHEPELRRRWREFGRRPRVVALRRRFARQIEFVEARLTPGGYLGLHLTVGAIIVLAAGWWFGELAEDLLTNAPLIGFDYRLANWLNRHGTAELTKVARAFTFTGSGLFLTSAGVVVGLILARKKAWDRLATLGLVLGGGSLLNVALKNLFQRTRPVVEHPLVNLSTYSFPSGHTIGATLFYGLMAFMVMQSVRRWRWRVLALLTAGLMILLVALSRIYLGAHYLSDVLAAMAVGIMWLAFCLTAVDINRRYRAHRQGSGRDAWLPRRTPGVD